MNFNFVSKNKKIKINKREKGCNLIDRIASIHPAVESRRIENSQNRRSRQARRKEAHTTVKVVKVY